MRLLGYWQKQKTSVKLTASRCCEILKIVVDIIDSSNRAHRGMQSRGNYSRVSKY